MATKDSLSTSKYDGRYYKLEWERTDTSVTNNTSTIKWTLSAVGGSDNWYAERTLEVVIAGTTVFSKTARKERYTGVIDSGTLTIKHNSDGSKSFSASVKAAVYTTSVNCTGSETFTLTAIPRASTVTATSAYVGNQTTITINRKSSSFTHTLTWECGSASGTIATKTTSTSVKWTLPTSLYAQIGSTATSKTVTITCKTYNGSTLIGDADTCTLSAKTSASRNGPELSPTVNSFEATQALTGDTTTLILNYSDANCKVNASPKDSATLKSVKITHGTKSRTSDGTISAVQSGKFTFTATDSRGYTTTKTITNKVINYTKPTCTFTVKMDVSGGASITTSGKIFNGSFGAVTNICTVQYRYKVNGGTYSSWTNMTATKSGNTYSASTNLSGLDYSKTYYFQTRVTDSIQTVTASEKKIKAYPVWDWGENDFRVNVPISAPNLGRTSYSIADNISDKGITTSATGYVYLLKPFNLVYIRLYINGFSASQSAGTSAITAFTLDDRFKSSTNTALSCYGVKSTEALINSNGQIRLRPRDGLVTSSELYISGIYPLSSESDLYI